MANFLLLSKSGICFCQVQNSFSPVCCISPWHLGQVCPSHIRILSLPHCKQSLPTSLLYEGATSAIIPPTTMFWMLLQSGHDTARISWRKSPRPSYTSASEPHWLQRYLSFQAISLLKKSKASCSFGLPSISRASFTPPQKSVPARRLLGCHSCWHCRSIIMLSYYLWF